MRNRGSQTDINSDVRYSIFNKKCELAEDKLGVLGVKMITLHFQDIAEYAVLYLKCGMFGSIYTYVI